MSPSTLAMFPGQGSQYVGMAKPLVDEFPKAKQVFEEAEDACKISLRKLSFEGPEADLQLTENTQPALLTVSIATWVVLNDEVGFKPDFFAGHSLGEYSALVAAGKLSLAQAAKLVKLRGKEMQSAVPVGKGAMLAVLGTIDISQLESLCKNATQSLLNEGLSDLQATVQIANYNSHNQIILSGAIDAIQKVASLLEGLGPKSKILPVSAPFHSALMLPARQAMESHLKDLVLNDNSTKIIANFTAEVEHPYTNNLLIQQIDGPVKWTQTIATATRLGVMRFVEVGPGKVLSGLIKRTISKESILISSDDIKDAIKQLNT